MELSQYLRLIRKWAWLLILMMVLTAFATLLYGRTIGVSYQTSTILRLGQLNQNANPNNGDITVLGSLTQAYVAMVTTEPVLQATVDATGWKGGGWGDLALEVAAAPIGTQLIVITVTDHDAHMAKAIADALANQLIVQSPTAGQQKKADEQRAFIQGQLTALSQEINNGQQSLDDLNAKANLETDPVKLKDLDNRISALQTKISDWQKSYTSYSDILNSSFTNYLTVLQPADEGFSPPRKLATEVVIGAIAGLILATVIIFTLEFLDDRLIDVERARQALQVPPLAAVAPVKGVRKPTDDLVVVKGPKSGAAELFRMLRINLRFAGLENPGGALLVTSAVRKEGKTMTAVNLAATFAQAGKRVFLVDANLRNPALHKVFNLPNQVGLSNLLSGDKTTLDQVKQPTGLNGLFLIPSGPTPPNPTELLDSEQMDKLMTGLRAESDMVILDGMSLAGFADAAVAGARCSGAIVVVDSTHTRSALPRDAIETLSRSNIKVFGVVLNKTGKPQSAK